MEPTGFYKADDTRACYTLAQVFEQVSMTRY